MGKPFSGSNRSLGRLQHDAAKIFTHAAQTLHDDLDTYELINKTMNLDTYEWDRHFAKWSAAKTEHLKAMEFAHLFAGSDSSRAADMMAAASIALADMQAAHVRMRALMRPGPFSRGTNG